MNASVAFPVWFAIAIGLNASDGVGNQYLPITDVHPSGAKT
jgi:hypothetical protein